MAAYDPDPNEALSATIPFSAGRGTDTAPDNESATPLLSDILDKLESGAALTLHEKTIADSFRAWLAPRIAEAERGRISRQTFTEIRDAARASIGLAGTRV